MKKILFVITKSNWGGAQKYVYDLATNMPGEEFDVAVACGGAIAHSSQELVERLHVAHVRTIFVSSFMRDIRVTKEIRAFFELLRIFKSEKPDIVHLNSSKAGGLGALAARFAGVPRIIFTAHGLAAEEDRSAFVRAAISCATWLTFLLCHTIIAVSQKNFNRAIRYPFCAEKIVLIYNGVRPVQFLVRTRARTDLLDQELCDRHASDTWVLTSAELTENKNLFTAIDAVAQAFREGARIFYCIMSSGELRGQLEKYIAEKHLEDHVELLGFVEEGARYLQAFDIFFLPSKKEGLPYVLLEAGLARVPVVASDIGGIPEIIQNHTSGLLERPDDVKGFAEDLASLSRSAEEREAYAQALEAHVKKMFSFDAMVRGTVSLY